MKQHSFRAVILLGTLKPSHVLSHTAVLSEALAEAMEKQSVQTEIIRLVQFDIKPGLKDDMGKGDEWPKILKKILAADIIILATPIWWGLQSSVIQRIIERMDSLNDTLLETGTSPFSNKVAGIIITGAEDGAMHIIGNLLNFLMWNGLTIPPASALSWLGEAEGKSKESLVKLFRKEPTRSMTAVMAQNLAFFAQSLREHPLPKAKGGIRKSIAPGTIGMKSKG